MVLHVRGQHRDGEDPGSNESLKEALHTVTERSDIKFGDVMYATDYRSPTDVSATLVIDQDGTRPSVRMVNKFSEGRVFVSGDAAHIHTPRGGQVSRLVKGRFDNT